VKGLEWIRLHYAYPSKFPGEILDVIRDREKYCNYLRPSAPTYQRSVLTRMRRQITKQEVYELIQLIREKVPGIALRTTMLVGFPGESEKDFEDLLKFMEETRFDRAGAFTISHEEELPVTN
jgi:ribosomal protein S12 methylthiotransferase